MKVRFLSGDTTTNDIFCVFKVFYSAIITDKFLIMRRMLVLHLFDAFQYKNHWCMSVWSTGISLNTWDINGQRMAETHHTLSHKSYKHVHRERLWTFVHVVNALTIWKQINTKICIHVQVHMFTLSQKCYKHVHRERLWTVVHTVNALTMPEQINTKICIHAHVHMYTLSQK